MLLSSQGRMNFARFKKIARNTLAGFMAVWLTGIIFLFCCEKINALPIEAEFCPLAKISAHCDKAEKANLNFALVENIESDWVECCGFLSTIFDKTRKHEQTQTAARPRTITLGFSRAVRVDKSIKIIPSRSHISDRQRTFLKNRTLRI